MFEFLASQPELSASLQRLRGDSALKQQHGRAGRGQRRGDLSGIDALVDVAGGHGEILMQIAAQAYPAMRGILFDVDHVDRRRGAARSRRAGAGRSLRDGDAATSSQAVPARRRSS